MLNRSTGKVAFLMICGVLMSACQAKFVEKAEIRQSYESQVSRGEITATLYTGDVVVPATEFSIVDAAQGVLGKVSLTQKPNAKKTELSVSFDIERIVQAQGHRDPYLPNGTLVPVSGFNAHQMKTFQLGGPGSKLYVNLDRYLKVGFVGLTVGVRNFYPTVSTSLFMPINFTDGKVLGLGGAFSGLAQDQSGFSVFFDVSSFVGGYPGFHSGNSVEFHPLHPGLSEYESLEAALKRLHQKKVTLEIH